ncbi:hypothetical protein [Marinicrinis lubricantis]|uniref:Sporulation protein YjcZ n=1 Tax=Marinicrinis lubricantis TaxID=2086470 RepID=A0ABW1ITX4_9BACL
MDHLHHLPNMQMPAYTANQAPAYTMGSHHDCHCHANPAPLPHYPVHGVPNAAFVLVLFVLLVIILRFAYI